jgi:hypothetical protein
MSEIMRFPVGSMKSDIIAKLIGAGYLQPQQRDDPAAITNAIARMKVDLRGGNGSDKIISTAGSVERSVKREPLP